MKWQQKIRVGLWFSVIAAIFESFNGLPAAVSEPPTTTKIEQVYGRGSVTQGDWSPDGRWFAFPTRAGDIELWDNWPGKMTRVIAAAHAGPVREIKFSPDGIWLASIGDDCRLKRWDLATGHAIASLALEARPMTFNLNSSGTLFAVILANGRVQVGSTLSNTLLKTATTLSMASQLWSIFSDPQFSPGDRLIALEDNIEAPSSSVFPYQNVIRISEWQTGKDRLNTDVQSHYIFGLTEIEYFFGYGNGELTNDFNCRGFLNDGTRWTPEDLDPGRQIFFNSLIYDAASHLVAGENYCTLGKNRFQHQIHVYERPGMHSRMILVSPLNVELQRLKITNDGKRLMGAAADGHLYTWDLQTGNLLRDIQVSETLLTLKQISYSPDGRYIGSLDSNDDFAVFDRESGKLVHGWSWRVPYSVEAYSAPVSYPAFRFSPDSTRVAIITSRGLLEIRDIISGSIAESIQLPTNDTEKIADIDFIADGNELGILSTEHLWVYNAAIHELKPLDIGGISIRTLNSNRILVKTLGELIEYSWPEMLPQKRIAFATNYSFRMDISTDAKRVICVANGHIFLYNWGTPELIYQSDNAGVFWPRDAKFSPDAKTFLLAMQPYDEHLYQNRETLQLCDAATGSVLRNYQAERPVAECCAVSPDGKYVISSTYGVSYAFKTWPSNGAVDWAAYE